MKILDTNEDLKNNSLRVTVWDNNETTAYLNATDAYIFTDKFDKTFDSASDAEKWLKANNYRLIGHDTID